MGLVALVPCALSLALVVRGVLAVPTQGSIPLFLCGAALHVFATALLGIFLATYARTMPQFALLMILILLPLLALGSGLTRARACPRGSRASCWRRRRRISSSSPRISCIAGPASRLSGGPASRSP